MSKDLLLEIGVEEIPPKELSGIAQQLKEATEAEFAEHLIDYRSIEMYFSPRRLVLLAKSVEERQRDKVKEIKGPTKRVGFDANGKPTQAALGFCHSHGASVEDLIVKKTEQGEYLFLQKTVPGEATEKLLPQLLPKIFKKINPSVSMVWDDSGLRFIRPIRWLLCLFGSEVISFELGKLKSGKATRAHRALGNPLIEITDSEDYFSKLKAHKVVIDQAERRAMIEAALKEIGWKLRAHHAADEDLLEEIAHSLEYPVPVLGKFSDEFLALPEEILATTMKEHLKFVPFAQTEEAQPTVPYFVGFSDGVEDKEGKIRGWYECILKGRLADSRFFFEADRKKRLVDYTRELRSVIYQEKLGTIWDKVERIRQWAKAIAEFAGSLRAHAKEIDRAAFLCKADLVTKLVEEFPSLEGIIGGIYAALDDESELVSKGIREHYMPKGADDPVPESETGIAISIADKLDTVVGALLIGEEPTGSRDPFGLRRKANGIIKIALEHKLAIDFFKLIRELEPELYGFLEKRKPVSAIEDFFLERLYQELRQDHQIDYDILEALVAIRDGNFLRVLRKARALEKIRGEQAFKDLVIAFSRARNISREHEAAGFEPRLFEADAEKELWRAYLKAQGQIEKLLPQEDYEGIIERLIALKAPIDKYFDDVLVMCPDRKLRQNRLGFLTQIVKLFFTMGDLSKIVVEGQTYANRQNQ